MEAQTHKSALVLIPPRPLWAPLQAIRRAYDPQYQRWMPHITLLYPFRAREAWPALLPALRASAAALAPFEVRLSETRVFRQGPNRHVIALTPQPAAAVERLHQALWRVVPDCDAVRRHAGGYTPHLTLARVNRRRTLETLLAQLRDEWQELRFRVDCVSLIWRGDPPEDRFRLGETLLLGGAASSGRLR
ncbi:2'-5' RNA ligase family protein [Ectothiorhodospiraceae bacterium 2226]|nr:2'-5' RNA ligase family protein [Ectothiorhodospiraceae bacterium 2226]